MSNSFLHEDPEFDKLCRIVADKQGVPAQLVEKDYWLMHVLWGLQQQKFEFELKGGTSLSKGFRLIHRFSEDIDILIKPKSNEKVPTGKNQTNPKQIAARRSYFDSVATSIAVPGIERVERDNKFDNKHMMSAGIRLYYSSANEPLKTLKPGILLEVGFDQTAPNEPRTITSWAYEHVVSLKETFIENRAMDVPCYLPGYTFVEKLQTISTKFRLDQATGEKPQNFIRHYYDVYCLLDCSEVQNFIGTEEYQRHKERRFRSADEKQLTCNEAFILSKRSTRQRYKALYDSSELYYGAKPSFDEILERIGLHLAQL